MVKKLQLGNFSAIGLILMVLVGGVIIITDNLQVIHSAGFEGSKHRAAQKKQMDLNQNLMRAASDGDLIEVTTLVEKGADINFVDEYGWTPLIQASMMNQLDIVKYLVVKGANINAVAEDGTNPLQNAIIFDHVAMVKFLLARGASLDAKGKYGWDGIQTAHQRDRRKVLNYLKHAGILTETAH
jgi:ankyrin repeat protein